MNGPVAGGIAGIVAAIMGIVFYMIGGMIGAIPQTPTNVQGVSGHIILTIVSGIIFGVLYAKTYDIVPGRGAIKGLYFGLLIWLFVALMPGFYVLNLEAGAHALDPQRFGLPWIFSVFMFDGFFMWVIAGPVLAALYKK